MKVNTINEMPGLTRFDKYLPIVVSKEGVDEKSKFVEHFATYSMIYSRKRNHEITSSEELIQNVPRFLNRHRSTILPISRSICRLLQLPLSHLLHYYLSTVYRSYSYFKHFGA